MRLSEAALLGSIMFSPKPACWKTCFIGIAGRAVGIEESDSDRTFLEEVLDKWPWLSANCDEKIREIVTLFDQRVCRGEMSFDSLVQYVASIEPPCECGVRDCCCARVEDLLPMHDVLDHLVQGAMHSEPVECGAEVDVS